VLQDYNKRNNRFTATIKFKPYVENDGRWITSRGEVLLRNSVVGMDEFGNKYMSRLSSPTLGIKQDLLKLFNFWRHMHCLMIGAGVSLTDFDRKGLDKATWEGRCSRLENNDCFWSDNPDDIIIGFDLMPIKYDPMTDKIVKTGNKERMVINASDPKHILGDKSWCQIFNTDNAQGFNTTGKRRKQ